MNKSILIGLGLGALYGLISFFVGGKVLGNEAFASSMSWLPMIIGTCAMVGGIVFYGIDKYRESLYFNAKRVDSSVVEGTGGGILSKILGVLIILQAIGMFGLAGGSYPLIIVGCLMFMILISCGVGLFNGKKYALQVLLPIILLIGAYFLMQFAIDKINIAGVDVELRRGTIRIIAIICVVLFGGLAALARKINAGYMSIYNKLDY